MKKLTKTLIKVGAISALTYGANRFMHYLATKDNLLAEQETLTYDWIYGKIQYKKAGHGSPLILLHDINHFSNCFEYNYVLKKLAMNHTVYAPDFLGCGQSDKPMMEYTNFLYVQMLCSFIENVIGDKASVVSNGFSSSVVVMAHKYHPDLFNQIVLTNPTDIYETYGNKKLEKYIAKGLEIPLFGTLAYNILSTREKLANTLKAGFHDKKKCSDQIIDHFYESAHLGDAEAKYIYASLKGNYLAANTIPALEEIDDLTIILGEEKERGIETASHYKKFVNHIHVYKIPNTKDYPHLETPNAFVDAVEHALKPAVATTEDTQNN